jgi:hypothetical protein
VGIVDVFTDRYQETYVPSRDCNVTAIHAAVFSELPAYRFYLTENTPRIHYKNYAVNEVITAYSENQNR